MKDGIVCVFTGRAHERAAKDLLVTQHDLAKTRQELINSQHSLANSRQENHDIRRDLTTSQLDLLFSQQYGRQQEESLRRVYEILRSTYQAKNTELSIMALQCKDLGEFSERLGRLPSDAQSDIPSPAISNNQHPTSIVLSDIVDARTPTQNQTPPPDLWVPQAPMIMETDGIFHSENVDIDGWSGHPFCAMNSERW
jgi:hypothetical protein